MTAEELGQMIWNVKELLRNVYDNKDVEDVSFRSLSFAVWTAYL